MFNKNVSFVFYESYYQKFLDLKDSNRKLAEELLEAIVEFGLYGGYSVS